MIVSARASLLAFVILALPVLAAAQPAAPVISVQVNGQTVSAAWPAVAGAVSYRAEAGATSGVMLLAQDIVANSFQVLAPQGTFYLRVRARNAQGALGAPSNEVPVVVTSASAPPSAPTGLAATVTGSTINFTVNLPAGPLTGLVLAAGLAPSQTLGVLTLPVAPQASLNNVPPGTYYARMVAVNNGGSSPASNEVQVVVAPSTCSPPAAPSVQVQVSGNTVSIAWSPVAGAAGYRLDVSAAPGGPAAHSQTFSAAQTTVVYPGVPVGTFYARVTAGVPCGAVATSADATIVVAGTGGTGNRTPNPPAPTPPNYLPLPNRSAVVSEMARLYPGDLRNSCRDLGGNNTWLYRVVERLRREDTRWGLNWKRANVGDMSQDIITYNFGPQGDEGTQFVHAVDIIGGHCGSNPSPSWNNVTVLFSTGAKWTLQPYLQAGFPLVP